MDDTVVKISSSQPYKWRCITWKLVVYVKQKTFRPLAAFKESFDVPLCRILLFISNLITFCIHRKKISKMHIYFNYVILYVL